MKKIEEWLSETRKNRKTLFFAIFGIVFLVIFLVSFLSLNSVLNKKPFSLLGFSGSLAQSFYFDTIDDTWQVIIPGPVQCTLQCGTQCCTPGQRCVNGRCYTDVLIICPLNKTACGTQCCDSTTQKCDNGKCISNFCVPNCTGRSCGSNGCGGSCGTCSIGKTCVSGTCSSSCVPNCINKGCGSDGCGGSCGTCLSGYTCSSAGKCVKSSCVPNCTGKSCGSNGCGGNCGTCPIGKTCDYSGQCISYTTCEPNCRGKSCGDDGCGGSCGTCLSGKTCDVSGKCVSKNECETTEDCGPDASCKDCRTNSTTGLKYCYNYNNISCKDSSGKGGACKDGKCLACSPKCDDDCQSCKINASGKPYCYNYNNISCKDSSGNGGACKDGKCLACSPKCDDDCQSCKINTSGKPYCYNYNNISCKDSSGNSGTCKNGKCQVVACSPAPNDCQKCDTSNPSKPVVKPDPDKKGSACALKGDTGTKKSGICDDKGVCQQSDCDPPCNSCQKCVKSAARSEKPKCEKDTTKDGTSCTVTLVPLKAGAAENGFCKDGVCKTKTCQSLGLPVTCGSNSSTGLKCCATGEDCWWGSGSVDNAVCCKPGEKKGYNSFVGPYCSPTSCKAGETLCPADGNSNWNDCCKSGETCYVNTTWGFSSGYCMKSKCGEGEVECGKNSKGEVFCCKAGSCDSDFVCLAKKCTDKEFSCSGKDPVSGKDVSVCCQKGTQACGSYPRGTPRCVSVGSSAKFEVDTINGSTNYNINFIEGSVISALSGFLQNKWMVIAGAVLLVILLLLIILKLFKRL